MQPLYFMFNNWLSGINVINSLIFSSSWTIVFEKCKLGGASRSEMIGFFCVFIFSIFWTKNLLKSLKSMFLKKVVLKSYPNFCFHFLVLLVIEIVVKMGLQKNSQKTLKKRRKNLQKGEWKEVKITIKI